MDPLSVTASAIAVIQLTTDLVKGTREFYKNVKNAPKEVAEFIDELNALGAVLERLRGISQKADEASSSCIAVKVSVQNEENASHLPMLKSMMKADGPLAICYEEMKEFQRKLTRGQSRLKKSLKWPFEKTEMLSSIERFRKLKSALDTAILSDHLALTMEVQNNIVKMNKAFQVARSNRLSEAMAIWLSAPDPASNLAAAREKRQKDTGIWLLKSPTFLKWINEGCSFLWLYGKPGSGKTVLSSTAIHSLFESDTGRANIVYFYFDFQTREKQLVQSFWKSIILQLFSQNDEFFDIIETMYNSHSRGSIMPSLRDLKATARQMFERSRAIYLVIDALDECEDRRSLLEGLKDFRSWGQQHVHLLATSRQEADIEDSLSMVATDKISLEECVVDADILCYVRHQLHHDERLSKWSEAIQKEIQETLLKGAKGMFRWVECQLDAIRGCMKPSLLRKALRSLPKTLDDTYTRILDKIPGDYMEDARRILSCLVCSFHPLAIEEIADTVAILRHGETYYDVDNRLTEPRDILKICSGLVTTTRSMRNTFFGDRQINIEELRLAHFSVKEYLVGNQDTSENISPFALTITHAHETLANLCMRYLAHCHEQSVCDRPSFLQIYIRDPSEEVAFAPYAASCWSRHLRAAQLDSSSPLYEQCLAMLTNPRLSRDLIRLYTPWFRYQELKLMRQCGYVKTIGGGNTLNFSVEAVPPLYLASLLGLDLIILRLLANGEDVNCFASEGSCLTAAVCGGCASTVELLISKGADINAVVLQTSNDNEVCYSKSAIHEAVYQRNEEIVTILLDHGADVNIGRSCLGKVGHYLESSTPLQEAVEHSQKHIVQLLLAAGADPNACPARQYPLELVQFRERGNEMMTRLLDCGADPNLTSDPRGIKTPLYHALIKGRQSRIDLLIDRGADLSYVDSRLVPFILLYWGSMPSILETLLRLPISLNKGRLLIATAKYGHLDIMDTLLQSGVPPDCQQSNGHTALHSAAFAPLDGVEEVRKLLDAGAEVNKYGGPFGSALQAAALSGKAETVQLLLENGASVNHNEGNYGSALRIAIDRLKDASMCCPETWTMRPDDITSYGPDGYYFWDGIAEYTPNITVREPAKIGDYEAKINIAHWPKADYQAVIDLLLTHGAEDV